jgi:hypothetical protein
MSYGAGGICQGMPTRSLRRIERHRNSEQPLDTAGLRTIEAHVRVAAKENVGDGIGQFSDS